VLEITHHADPLYPPLIITRHARKAASPLPSSGSSRRNPGIRIVDMSDSNAWAKFAGIFARTRAAYLEHEPANTELKSLMPEDAKETIGHCVRAKRSQSGPVR
jgi:hypothetical protein